MKRQEVNTNWACTAGGTLRVKGLSAAAILNTVVNHNGFQKHEGAHSDGTLTHSVLTEQKQVLQ